MAAVGQLIVSTPGVVSVHDLHIWALTSGKSSLTAHVVHDPAASSDAIINALKVNLADRFNVFHTTLQLETKPCAHTEDGCNFIDPRPPAITTEHRGAAMSASPLRDPTARL